MAMRGTPLPAADIRRIQQLREVLSQRQTAREVDVARETVRKYENKDLKFRPLPK